MKIVLTTISLVTLLAYNLRGQEMTFAEAINIGLSNSLEIQQNQNNLSASMINMQSAKLNLVPSLSIRGTAARRTGNTFNQQEAQLITGTVDFISGSISADLPLFNGMRNYNTIKSTTYRYEAQMETVEFSRQTLMVNIATQYLQVLVNQELLNIARENLTFQEKNLDQVTTEVELGRKPEIDRFNQVSEVKNAELNVFRAQVNLRNSKATLATTLMINPTEDFSVSRESIQVEISDADLNQEALESIALTNRGDYHASKLNEEAALFERKASRASALPSLNAFADGGSQFNRVMGFPSRSFSDQFFTDNRFIAYGVSLFIPLFTNYDNRAQYTRQRVAYENAKLNSESIENNIKSSVLTSYLNYQDAIKQYEMAAAQLQARETSNSLNSESFELGLIDLLTYSQTTRDYYNAKSDMVQAELNLIFQKIILKANLGVLTEEEIRE